MLVSTNINALIIKRKFSISKNNKKNKPSILNHHTVVWDLHNEVINPYVG